MAEAKSEAKSSADKSPAERIAVEKPTADKPATEKAIFHPDLIRKYPRSNKKVTVGISPYGLSLGPEEVKSQTVHISPHGVEFQALQEYAEGTLLKISIALPDYWKRKQRFVEYGRIDRPDAFRILAKVVRSEDVGKRGKKKLVLAQTLNMDEVDEQVLKSYLQEG